MSGIRGYPPPPTTKLAIFYNDGFQCEFSLNATAYSWERKFVQYEAQLKQRLQHHGVLDHFDTLEFQR